MVVITVHKMDINFKESNFLDHKISFMELALNLLNSFMVCFAIVIMEAWMALYSYFNLEVNL